MSRISYGDAIRMAFEYLLAHHKDVFVMGQGLWSPWYVGNSMTDLDKTFGKSRVIDTPVSELACTGAAVGASLCGYRPIIVHPRMDFMLYAMDAIVNQAAKWSHMFGAQSHAGVTIRAIVNRGGEQGAQHSQALHAWFAHVPGLRVVMPYSPIDARDLLIASVLCDDPVVYIDDRWLYELSEPDRPIRATSLLNEGPVELARGDDVTLVGASYSTHLCVQAASRLREEGIDATVIDLRVINPLDCDVVIQSVKKTGRLCVVDGGWSSCGLAGEVIASVTEHLDPRHWRTAPRRITLPDAPAPTSGPLEKQYYASVADIVNTVKTAIFKSRVEKC